MQVYIIRGTTRGLSYPCLRLQYVHCQYKHFKRFTWPTKIVGEYLNTA